MLLLRIKPDEPKDARNSAPIPGAETTIWILIPITHPVTFYSGRFIPEIFRLVFPDEITVKPKSNVHCPRPPDIFSVNK
jgi:hypothetical protein